MKEKRKKNASNMQRICSICNKKCKNESRTGHTGQPAVKLHSLGPSKHKNKSENVPEGLLEATLSLPLSLS